MCRRTCIGLAAAAFMLVGATSIQAQIAWVFDYNQGTAQAVQDGKACIVYFHSNT